ncbi:MAG: tRNA (adenosine(37)-N6)-dimethylallyltransferase MiaA [Clostridiales bacterium]|jgi:tRNA dimethylallyltransferase|nr:tRNA (adenosine(37)-N6)-dimethylallyltransferase MiaA [Clostridiales bacterium]
MQKIIVVAGPTASGKSAFAVTLAKSVGGAVISADSMQIYRGLDIGTAKATAVERAEVPHYLIDIVDADDEFSVAAFRNAADDAIRDAVSKGFIPIIAGGTGLYIDALLYKFSFSDTPKDSGLRDRLRAEAETDLSALYARLTACDPDAAARIHSNDAKRIVRALEIFELTGAPKRSGEREPRYDALRFGMLLPRETLYERINARVDRMFSEGLEREVSAAVVKTGFDCQSMQAIGYKEFENYFKNAATLEETKELIKKNTRNYAKRQMTWFRKSALIWISPFQTEQAAVMTREFLEAATEN